MGLNAGRLLSEEEQLVDGSVKLFGDVHGELEGGIIAAFLKVADGFSATPHPLGELCLAYAHALSVFVHPCGKHGLRALFERRKADPVRGERKARDEVAGSGEVNAGFGAYSDDTCT